jgi:RNA polymerase sigma factor, sigma-70 family
VKALHGCENPEGMDDEELVRLAGEGSEGAITALIHRYAPMVQKFADRYSGPWLDAEDLAQEGLLGLLAAVRGYRLDGGASFATYAAVCVRRRMLSELKRVGSLRNIPASELASLDDGGVADLPDGQAGPENLVLEREEALDLRRRLGEELTELEYEVLMYHLRAYSYEEIAAALHIGVKTVDNALQRVRRKLASRIWPDFTRGTGG